MGAERTYGDLATVARDALNGVFQPMAFAVILVASLQLM